MTDEIKKKKKPKNSTTVNNVDLKQTKEELMIAKYMRTHLPVREGKLITMVVNIFDANDAVNLLMESKWAKCSDKHSLLFPSRHYTVEYLKTMMAKNFFHRAIKVKKSRKKVDDKVKKKAVANLQKPVKKDGKKARMKLEVHDVQAFNPDDPDNDDVYVWIYEPFNPWKFLLGFLVLLVILGFCLFPIWPSHLRSVAYYGSIGCMGILGVLVALIFMRGILFGMVWLFSFGHRHFWLLPNLTADCGVLDSFKPFFEYKYKKNKVKKLKSEDKGLNNGDSIIPQNECVNYEEELAVDDEQGNSIKTKIE